MRMQKVESSNIAEMGHKGTTMRVLFHNGGLYDYAGVPLTTYHEIVNAESVGSTFHRLVKSRPDDYPYTRVN